MPVTPMGIPYPSLTDAPNGPAQMQALATGVEAAIVAYSATASNTNLIVRRSVANSNFALGLAATTIPGCSLTFNTTNPNVKILISGTFDFVQHDAAGVICNGGAWVDGAQLPGDVNQSICIPTRDGRATNTGIWIANLAVPGSHTVLLTGRATQVGQGISQINNTAITILQFAA